MARYFLHLCEDDRIGDEDGVELPDLAAARAEAIAGGRSVMAELLLTGLPINLDHHIEIADASERIVATLTFRELVTIVGN